MKNLPEKDFWKDVGNRLDAYTEEPDNDSWDRIAGAVSPPQPPKGLVWIDRFAGVALLIYVSFMAGYSVGREDHTATPDRDTILSPGMAMISGDASSDSETKSVGQPLEEDAYSRTVPAGPSLKGTDSSTKSPDRSLTGTSPQVPGQTRSSGESRSYSSGAELKVAPLNDTTGRNLRNGSDDETKLSDAHAVTAETEEIPSGMTRRNRSGDNDRETKKSVVTSAEENASSGTTGRKLGSGSDDAVKKSDEQVVTSAKENTSPGTTGRDLRSGSDGAVKKSDDPMVASAEENTSSGTTGRNLGGGGDDVVKKSDEHAITSAAANTPAGTTDMLVQRNKLQSEGNISAADSVIDSVAVKKVIRPDSTLRKTATEPKTPAKKKTKIRPQVYFTLAPSLSFQKITPEQTDAVNIRGLRSPGVLSADRFGISLEGGLQRPLTKHLEVYTGISFYQQKQNLTYEYLSPDSVEVTSPGNGQYTIKPKTETRDFKYSMLNAGISAGLFYRIKGEKLMHKLGAGIQYQKGLLRMGSEDTYDNAGSSYLNYQISYRVEYLLNSKVNIFIQPGFTHSFYAKEKLAEPFTIKPYRAGIGFGMIYHF